MDGITNVLSRAYNKIAIHNYKTIESIKTLTCSATSLANIAEFSHVIVGSMESKSVKLPSLIVIYIHFF